MPLTEIAIVAWLILAAQGIGWWPGRWLAGPGRPGLIWGQIFGWLGLIALAAGLSLLYGLRPIPVGIVLALAALAGVWSLIAARRERGGPTGAPWSRLEKLLAAGIAFGLWIGLIQALAPPTWGDGLHSLFVFARDYGRAGTVQFQPYVYATRPQNMVLLFSLGQLFGRAEASQLITWWLGSLAVGLVVIQIGRLINRFVGLAAGLIIAAMPLYVMLLGRGMSGLGVVLFGLAGLMAAHQVFRSAERSVAWSLAAGLLLGTAAGFKIIGLTVLATGLIISLAEVFRRRRCGGRLAVIVVLGLAAAAPWYAYSYLHTGTAFYYRGPFQGAKTLSDQAKWLTVQPGQEAKELGSETESNKKATTSPSSPSAKRQSAVSRLGTLIYRVISLERHDVFGGLWRINTVSGHRKRIIGPVILALAPLLLLVRPVNRTAVWFTLAGLIQLVMSIAIFGDYARYALPGLALAAVGAGAAWQGLRRIGPWAGRAAALVVAIGWLAGLPLAAQAVRTELPPALGLVGREGYLDQRFPRAMPVYRWANTHLPSRAVVAIIAESRPYFLDRPYFLASPNVSPLFDWRFLTTPAALDKAVRAVGADYALINLQYSDNAWEVWRGPVVAQNHRVATAWAAGLEPLFINGPVGLYRLPNKGESQ